MSDHVDFPLSADSPVNEPEGGPRFEPYESPAGGWGALQATAKALREQSIVLKGSKTLLSMNQPDGFDCPGCAWPDPRHTSSFEFCENGAKAVAFELTKRRVTREFFAAHTVHELEQQSDYWLEEQGRLTEPMRYDRGTDHFVPVSWEDAFAVIGRELRTLADPNEAEFYTSGRTSNEAAFLYQLFVRRFGTNNFLDCSNMCHEPTSVGLPESIGIGKGTVILEDFAHAEAIFVIGQNPGTNSPRMMTELRNASRRGVPIVVFNPLRERTLERFAAPQSPVEMATFGSTRIASEYCQVRVGGDVAALKGVMKLVLEAHETAVRVGDPAVLDVAFIAQHTQGFDALAQDLWRTRWDDILRVSGLSRDQLERVAAIYARANAVIVCYGMGITQHRLGSENGQRQQSITVQDSMSTVHTSIGLVEPPRRQLTSEVATICGTATSTLSNSGIDWSTFESDYDLIRDKIEAVFPDLFHEYDQRIRQPGGFQLDTQPRDRVWKTPSGRANFLVFDCIDEEPPVSHPVMLRCATLGRHDQYNITTNTKSLKG